MGQQPKSIADHKREGTYRANVHGDRLDERDWHSGGSPTMPNGLTPRQQWAWNQVVGGIRAEHLAELDSLALISLVRWYAIWDEAMQRIDDATDQKARWVATCEAGSAWKHCVQLMSKFGMTPADRSKFKKSAPSGPTDSNPIAALSAMVANKN